MDEITREIEPSDLPDFCRKPTLVLGCGNTLFGDDGFGCALIEYVEAHYEVPESVCLLDVGTGVRKLLFTLCLSPARPQRLLILDAIDAGRSPGEVFEIDPSEIPPGKARRLLTAPIADLQFSPRIAGILRRRSESAGLPNRAAAGRGTRRVVGSREPCRTRSG